MEAIITMKNRVAWCSIFLLLILMSCAVWASERDDTGDDSKNAVDTIKEGVLDYFQPLSGLIAESDSGLAKVKLEKDLNVKKGMRFTVFREGAPFYHPVTNELLGKAEDFAGTVEVMETESREGLYVCKIVKGDVKTGDIVRITSSKIKIAFFQDRKANWSLSEVFYKELKDSGRFDILESYTSSYGPEHLSGLASKLGADAVLLFSTPFKNEIKILNVKLFWAKDAKMFGEIESIIDQDAISMTEPYEVFLSAAADTEPWGSYELPNGRLIAMGDVDGKGAREVVVSDDNDIKVYSLKDELRELWKIKGEKWGRPLSIDILDVNGNGVAEIFVTSLVDEEGAALDLQNNSAAASGRSQSRLNSYVIEYDPSEGYRKIADNLPYFLRVAGNTLLMQKYSANRVFADSVYEGKWEAGKYTPKRALKLPDTVNIYGFAYVDWMNSGEKYLVSFDDKGYISMYDEQGTPLWESSRTYGTFEMSFRKKTSSMVNPVIKWAVRGRLIPVNTAHGQEIIVVRRSPLIKEIPGLGNLEAEVYSLRWDGASMDEQLVLKDIAGTVTDYWIEGSNLFLVARGNMMSLVKNATSGEFFKGTVLYYYNFGKK